MTEPVAKSAPFRFGVSQFTTTPWSFERDVEEYARLGVDTIEVCEFKLDVGQGRAEEQLALVADAGLEISSVQPAVRTLYPSRTQRHPGDLDERIEHFRSAIERVAGFAPGVPFVCNTGPSPGGNVIDAIETAAKEYRSLADFSGEHGVKIALEPLNPVLMNVESAIWTLSQAMRVVEVVDRENFGVCVDTWNIWQNESVVEEIKGCGDRIFVVQVSDWKTPRSFADRHVVGEGEIPTAKLLRAVRETGYDGPYTLEIFSDEVPDSLWDDELSKVIQDSRNGLEDAWEEIAEPQR